MKALRVTLLVFAILCILSGGLLFLLYRSHAFGADMASIGIIGGADGPTAIWVTGAWSPLSLVPVSALGGAIFFAAWLILFVINEIRRNKTSL